ncbi:MAG: hypothetical protein M3R13_07815 [Armatimonadota bacterium]|nr:hypothetical protein [Armatimonadota bacterium]
MSARDGLVLGCRLLAIYYFVDAVVRVVEELVYVVGLAREAEGLYLPHFAVPTVLLFAALLLWFYSPSWSQKAFPQSGVAQQPGGSADVPKTLVRLVAIYFLVGGVATVLDFMVRTLVRSAEPSGIFWSPPASWNDLASAFVWLVTGLILYCGGGKVTGAIKGAGNAIADDLWRIKPEDDEPKTQA